MPLASLISGAGELIGGLFGQSEREKERSMQKTFAKKGIQWRVQDAKAAGVHPLYALGAQTTSYAPTAVGGGLGEGIANMGQDIGRAVSAGMSSEERGFNKTVQAMTVERMGLENELLRSQIRRYSAAGSAAGLPSFGVDASDAIRMAGVDIERHPDWSDAEAIQNRYGEPAEWLYFPFVSGADASKALKSKIGGVSVRPGSFAEDFINSEGTRLLRKFLSGLVD